MYARLSYSKESRTISFAASELKHYLLKVNNTINFTNDTTADSVPISPSDFSLILIAFLIQRMHIVSKFLI